MYRASYPLPHPFLLNVLLGGRQGWSGTAEGMKDIFFISSSNIGHGLQKSNIAENTRAARETGYIIGNKQTGHRTT